jgi:transcriptional regulator with XRE-family HTH domain
MSAQQLSDEVARLGVTMPRGVIAKLESGIRASVTVDELLALAAALDVPPLWLLFPLDSEKVERLPGEFTDPWTAMRRFAGIGTSEMELLAEYDDDEQKLRSLLHRSVNRHGALDVPERKAIPSALGALARTRQKFVARGLAEPDLAADVKKMLATPHLLNGGPAAQATAIEHGDQP